MVGFKVLSAMKDASFDKKQISSLTLAIGDLIERDGGAINWIKVDNAAECFTRKAIVVEDVTNASEVLVYELDGNEIVEVQSNATADAAHNGDRMFVTDENTINNSGTDRTDSVCVFIQDKIGSTTTSIIGRVLVGNSVDYAQ